MKFLLHWIVCHTVLLVLSLFIVAAVFFRGPLFGLWPEAEPVVESQAETMITPGSEQSSEQAIDTLKPVLETLAVSPVLEQPAEEPVLEAEPVAVPEKSADVLKSSDQTMAEAPDMEHPVEASDPAEKLVPVDEPTLQEASTTGLESQEHVVQTGQPEESPVAETLEVIPVESAESLQAEENYQFRPPEQQPVEDADIKEDLLQQARKAYWNDDLEKARTLYQAYINLNPENPDGYGELGNLLSTQGNLNSAAHMYRKAAELLEKEGKSEQAAQLKEVLSSIEVIQNTPE